MIDAKIASELVLLNNKKDLILKTARKVFMNSQYTRLENKFEEYNRSIATYYNSLLDNALALQQNISARKSVKIDPYIAGGLAQGAAGIGAGLYAASSSANRNLQIDKMRIESQIDVLKTNSVMGSAEYVMLSQYKEIISIIYSDQELASLHQKLLKEKQEADELVKKKESSEKTKSSIVVGVAAVIMAIIIFSSDAILLAMLGGIVSMPITAIILEKIMG